MIDFDAAVRDPDRPTQLLPAYDSGDHLHVNDAGNIAQGNVIPLTLFRAAGSARAISETDTFIRDMGDKSVAPLGESRLHGFRRALRSKAEVERRLVHDCCPNPFFIENGL